MKRVVFVGTPTVDVHVKLENMVYGDSSPAIIDDPVGGSATIAAVNATALAPSLDVRLLGLVGDDDRGRRAKSYLRSRGVKATLTSRGSSAAIVVLVDASGERTMFVDPGSTATAGPEDFDLSQIQGSSVVVIEGWFLFNVWGTELMVAIADAARQTGAIIVVDVCSAGRVRSTGLIEYRRRLSQVQPDVLLANSDEADELGLSTSIPRGVGYTVSHHGYRPSRVQSRVHRREVEVRPVDAVVDTAGAGDVFAAGVAVRLAAAEHCNLDEIVEAVEFAHSWARMVVAVRGYYLPTASSIESIAEMQ